MTPRELEQRVREQRQRQEQEHQQQLTAAYARSLRAKRYVSLTNTDDGATLSIEGLGHRPSWGWTIILAAVAFSWVALLLWLWALIPLGLLFLLGVRELFYPRTLYRIMLSGGNFALFQDQATEPYLFGQLASTEMTPYTWREDQGILVRAYGLTPRDTTIIGVSHPEDLALIAQFCAIAKGRRR